mmetsp:Transcript_25220/g.81585  ORF Transcript_25220/g.81585 Transcript_25220/m.81585 type:complete len:369 (+) Transcript_25220:736-1842(+)
MAPTTRPTAPSRWPTWCRRPRRRSSSWPTELWSPRQPGRSTAPRSTTRGGASPGAAEAMAGSATGIRRISTCQRSCLRCEPSPFRAAPRTPPQSAMRCSAPAPSRTLANRPFTCGGVSSRPLRTRGCTRRWRTTCGGGTSRLSLAGRRTPSSLRTPASLRGARSARVASSATVRGRRSRRRGPRSATTSRSCRYRRSPAGWPTRSSSRKRTTRSPASCQNGRPSRLRGPAARPAKPRAPKEQRGLQPKARARRSRPRRLSPRVARRRSNSGRGSDGRALRTIASQCHASALSHAESSRLANKALTGARLSYSLETTRVSAVDEGTSAADHLIEQADHRCEFHAAARVAQCAADPMKASMTHIPTPIQC